MDSPVVVDFPLGKTSNMIDSANQETVRPLRFFASTSAYDAAMQCGIQGTIEYFEGQLKMRFP